MVQAGLELEIFPAQPPEELGLQVSDTRPTLEQIILYSGATQCIILGCSTACLATTCWMSGLGQLGCHNPKHLQMLPSVLWDSGNPG